MRKLSPEALLTIAVIILLTLLPILVGWLIIKVYRRISPIQDEELTGLASVGAPERDGFFKIAILGWVVCSPVYYWVSNSGVLG